MEYEVSLQTIAWINERKVSERLEISPKFQRRAVWLEKERSELIKTIIQGLPFPEIYMQVVTNQETGDQQYIVVDGQQRITSILMFIDGEVSLPAGSDWEGYTFRNLSDDEKRKFWDYKIVVRMLRNTNDIEIRDLFERLNTNNVKLNDQEIRNAKYSGKFKQACEILADDPIFQKIGLFTPRELRRMEDIEFVSELLVLVIDGVQNKKDNLEDYYANFNEDFPNESEYLLEFRTAVNLLQQLVTPRNAPLVKTKSNFYSVFGACLRFYRYFNRSSFRFSDQIIESITNLLDAAKSFKVGESFDNENQREYYDAVSRAASDRSRRFRREQILFDIISEIENQ